MAEKDKEIVTLSDRVQALESQLREAMGQRTTSDDDEEDMQVAVEISNLRVQLAEAKTDKEKMQDKMEIVLEQQKETTLWIEALEKITCVRRLV